MSDTKHTKQVFFFFVRPNKRTNACYVLSSILFWTFLFSGARLGRARRSAELVSGISPTPIDRVDPPGAAAAAADEDAAAAGPTKPRRGRPNRKARVTVEA